MFIEILTFCFNQYDSQKLNILNTNIFTWKPLFTHFSS